MENNKENGETTVSNPVTQQDADKEATYPEVKFRNKKSHDSASERKRRSKNRLSNRRSTGVITAEEVDQARDFVDLSQTGLNTEFNGNTELNCNTELNGNNV